MDSTNNERFHHSQETPSEKDFTSSGQEELSLIHLFHEPNDTTYNADHNNTITVPANTSSSENSEIQPTYANEQRVTSKDVEEKPEHPQAQLLWALKNNELETFSSLLEVKEVDPKFKYGKPEHTTCIELACKLHWGEKFVKILLQHGVKTNVHEIHPEPIHHAAKYGNPEALELLLQNKRTKVNVVDSSGRTALHHAVRYSQDGRDAEYEHCIKLLLKRPDLVLNIPN